MNKQLLLFLLLLNAFILYAQENNSDEDYVTQVLKYDDFTYKSNIKTVQFHQFGWDYAAPIVDLAGTEKLQLNFDDLDGDHKQYTLSFVFCNADWSPSNLMVSEYLEGYYDINLINFSYSLNTFQKYTFYSIVFPQNNVRFTKSGNYIMYVYEAGDKKNLVLSRRFMVYDDKTKITCSVRQPIAGEFQFSKQQIDFNITGVNYQLNNPYKDLNVVITQNHRWDNAVTDIKPTFINGPTLEYSLNEASLFDGGNEFRYFDARSVRFLTERVKEIYKDETFKYHFIIYPEDIRKTRSYFFSNDINGEFLIKNSETPGNPDTESDYVYVHFFLPYLDPEPKGNFYILGKLTDWRMNKKSRLEYNTTRMGYEIVLCLKQGYYNYMLVLSDDSKKGGDQGVVEGNHWETENEYNIFVYHRQFGTYYDQLIGYKKFSSYKR